MLSPNVTWNGVCGTQVACVERKKQAEESEVLSSDLDDAMRVREQERGRAEAEAAGDEAAGDEGQQKIKSCR